MARKISNISKSVRLALESLRKHRPVFHLEADFQHELACELSQAGFARVRVGLPVEICGERKRVDIVAEGVAIEVKYILKKFELPCWDGEKFSSNRIAVDRDDRAMFWGDVWRLERMKSYTPNLKIKRGFAVMLTNRTTLWTKKYDHYPTCEGCKETTPSGKTYTPEWGDWSDFHEYFPKGKNLRFRYALVEVKRD